MALGARKWVSTGSSKTASSTLTTTGVAVTASDYPKVGDLLVVGVAADNLTSSTPTLSSVSVGSAGGTGTGATGSWTIVPGPGSPQSTAAAGVVTLLAYATVTTAFTNDDNNFTATLSGSVTAKAILVWGFSGVNTALLPTSANQSGTATSGYVTVTAPSTTEAWRIFAAATENEATSMGVNGSIVDWKIVGTTGAGAASNACISLVATNSNALVGSFSDGGYLAIELTPASTDFTGWGVPIS